MIHFTIVSGNKHKLAEFQRLLPSTVEFDSESIDLDEIQSLDVDLIIADKAKRAYEILKKPVVVDDAGAGLDSLQGLPGPFIKFFHDRLGFEALYQLAGEDKSTTVTCAVAYYDGNRLLIGHGETHGHVVPMIDQKGFGFENVFVPEGYDQRMADLPPETKDQVGHRGKAIRDLLKQLGI